MLRAITAGIKANRSTRRRGDLVFEVVPTAVDFPNAVNVEKEKTRWQLFAESRGLRLRKKSRLVYSDELKQWVPRWGSKSMQNVKMRSGVLEVEQSLSRLKKEKRQRVAKNKKNMLANKKRIAKL